MQQNTTPAQLRAAAEKRLKPLGARRLKLLAQLEELDRELRPMVVSAIRTEVTYRRITELTGLSHNTSRTWLRRAEEAEKEAARKGARGG